MQNVGVRQRTTRSPPDAGGVCKQGAPRATPCASTTTAVDVHKNNFLRDAGVLYINVATVLSTSNCPVSLVIRQRHLHHLLRRTSSSAGTAAAGNAPVGDLERPEHRLISRYQHRVTKTSLYTAPAGSSRGYLNAQVDVQQEGEAKCQGGNEMSAGRVERNMDR